MTFLSTTPGGGLREGVSPFPFFKRGFGGLPPRKFSKIDAKLCILARFFKCLDKVKVTIFSSSDGHVCRIHPALCDNIILKKAKEL